MTNTDPMPTDTHDDDAIGTADIAAPAAAASTDGAEQTEQEERTEELFSSDDSASFEQRWTEVQTRFVDDPRDAVASADHLVAEVMQTLARRFSDRKSTLEHQWDDEGQADTEELRRAMQEYRSFFQRLLAA